MSCKIMKYFRPLPTLESDRLIFRRAYLTDADDLFKCMKNEKISRYEVWRPHKTILETLGFVNNLIIKFDKYECTEWVIERKRDSRAIGVINLHDIAECNSKAEMGFWIAEDCWGQGYAFESADAVMNFCFNTVGLNRLMSMCAFDNFPSERLLLRLGMVYEGTLRQHISIKGNYTDIKVFSMLKGEYKNMNERK